MKKNKSFLCIIPAREGSKGIINKNIVDLNGSPLISYVIIAAMESKIFDKIIVSTDSKQIAQIAEEYNAEIPFIRPSYLATDDSKVEDTIVHALQYIEKHDKKYDYVCLLQPTSPLVKYFDIEKAVDLIFEKNGDMVVSVGESPINMQWSASLSKDLSMKNFSYGIYGTNRQSCGGTYYLNGAIYIGKWNIFYEKKNYYKQNTYAYIMPYEKSIDIDSKFDLKMVEYLIKENNDIKN